MRLLIITHLKKSNIIKVSQEHLANVLELKVSSEYHIEDWILKQVTEIVM